MSGGRAKAMLTEEDATADPMGVKDINLAANVVHRAFRYAPDHPGLAGRDLSCKTAVFPGRAPLARALRSGRGTRFSSEREVTRRDPLSTGSRPLSGSPFLIPSCP